MGRRIEAEYLANQNVLKLTEPLDGMSDHAKVALEVIEPPVTEAKP
jgi:hypothetical protein